MKLRYTRPALADIEDLAGYLEARSPQGALRVRRRIKFLMISLPIILSSASGRSTRPYAA